MAYATGANAPQVDINTESGIRWSAVFAGWVVASGMAFLLYVAGLAIGFAAFDPYNAAATAKGIGMGTAVWIVLTWAVSCFMGGMFASWFDGKADRTAGALHGVTVWGLSIAVSVVVFALGVTQVAQGGAGLMRGAATAGAAAAGPASNAADDATTGLQALLTQRIAQTNARAPAEGAQTAGGQVSAADVRRAADQLDRRTIASVAGALLKGDTENAKALLTANTSMSQAEIDQTLQSVTAQVDKLKAQAQAAAERAAHYTAMAMWIVFFSSLLALVAAAVGGWLGAGHIHRVYHLRRFETTTARQA